MEDFFILISLCAKPGREQALRGHLIELTSNASSSCTGCPAWRSERGCPGTRINP